MTTDPSAAGAPGVTIAAGGGTSAASAATAASGAPATTASRGRRREILTKGDDALIYSCLTTP